MKKFHEILKKEQIFHQGNFKNIIDITNNTKNVKKDYLFIAIKGTKFDGHLFVEDAIQRGAILLSFKIRILL